MNADDIYFDYTLPEEAKTAIHELKQVFGEEKGYVNDAVELNRQKNRLTNMLSKYKNVKFGPKRDVINLERHKKRMEIRKQISEIEDRLEALKTEVEGKR